MVLVDDATFSTNAMRCERVFFAIFTIVMCW